MNKIELTQHQIELIAEELDCGFKCFYHLGTKEIKSLVADRRNGRRPG
jgi:hypothetical protein